ncbi:MAG: DUF1254 domain-containing protein [Deltaproteobacteria bacterium]|nr:DUF1254 domain-containing protein [Deltaproteobacteria bacterium]
MGPGRVARTPLPEAIATPARVDTSIGALELPLGIPTRETADRAYAYLDELRAVEAFTSSLAPVSLYAIREGLRGAGIADHDVLLFPRLMDSRSLFLTANADTVYFVAFLDLGDGPVVVDVPPRVLGVADDMWFRWVTDFGISGPDRGEGGRYLFVPPDHAGALPEGGCYICRSRTNHVLLLGRAFLEDDDPAPAEASIREHLKIAPYVAGGVGSSIAAFLRGDGPLAAPIAPPRMRFVDGSGLAIDTIPPNDASFFDMLDAVVQLEPASAMDPELAGQFAALGIVKDRPFDPDERTRQQLARSVALANAIARVIAMRPREQECFGYYDGSAWLNTLFVGGYTFSQPPAVVGERGVEPAADPNARALASRTAFFYLATGVTPAMAMRLTDVGSQYLGAFVDANGEPLDGAYAYRIVLPPGIPAARFWSVTLYDNQSRSMLQTDQLYPRAGSQAYPSPAAVASDDGSIAIHLAPACPDGVARGNWIQTVPGAGYFAILRFYGPQASFFDRTWRPSEIERVAR